MDHQETDRVPVGFNWGSQEEMDALLLYMKLRNHDELLNALKVDIRRVSPLVYKGEQRYYQGEKADFWGVTQKSSERWGFK